MNNLDMRIQLLKARIGLTDDQVEIIKEEVIQHAVSSLNQAQTLIAKKVDPEIMRQMMEGHGVSYDGHKKKFI